MEDVLREFNEPYPEDIIDRVFQKIATRERYRARYQELLDATPKGKRVVNPHIGLLIRVLTGMETKEFPCTPCPDSKRLVSHYSKLRYGQN